jgi:hypothetical protein
MKLKEELEAIRWAIQPSGIKAKTDAARVTASLDEDAHAIARVLTVHVKTGVRKVTRKKRVRFNIRWSEKSDVVLWIEPQLRFGKFRQGSVLICGFERFLLLVRHILVKDFDCSDNEASRVMNELLAQKIKIATPPTSLVTSAPIHRTCECSLDLV